YLSRSSDTAADDAHLSPTDGEVLRQHGTAKHFAQLAPLILDLRAQLSTHETIDDLFSNVTWGLDSNDSSRLKMVNHWSTDHTSIYFILSVYVLMHVGGSLQVDSCSPLPYRIGFHTQVWMSLLASTIPVPSGMFIPGN